MNKAQLSKEASELRNFEPSIWSVDIEITELLQVISASETEIMEKLGDMMPKIQMSPRNSEVFEFIEKAQRLFAEGLPLHCIEAVLKESKAEAYFRETEIVCPWAKGSEVFRIDLSSSVPMDQQYSVMAQALPEFMNSTSWHKSLMIRVPQSDFIAEDTEEAHNHNEEKFYEYGVEYALAFMLKSISKDRVFGMRSGLKSMLKKDGDLRHGLFIVEQFPSANQIMSDGIIGMDAEAIAMGPSFSKDHNRYAPEFIIISNKQKDLDSLGNEKRSQIGVESKRRFFTHSLQKIIPEIPNNLSYDQASRLYSIAVLDKKLPRLVYSVSMSDLYPNPHKDISEEDYRELAASYLGS